MLNQGLKYSKTGGQGCKNGRDPHDPSANETNPPGQRCPGQTEDEYVTEFSVWALAGGEIIFSSDPRNMTAFQKKVWFNTEILAVYNDTSGFMDVMEYDDNSAVFEAAAPTACALTKKISHAKCTEGVTFGCTAANNSMWTDGGCRGVFTCNGVEHVVADRMSSYRHEYKCVAGKVPAVPDAGPAQVWLRPTADGGAAVVLHNPAETAATITVDFSKVPKRGWAGTTELQVRDLCDLI